LVGAPWLYLRRGETSMKTGTWTLAAALAWLFSSPAPSMGGLGQGIADDLGLRSRDPPETAEEFAERFRNFKIDEDEEDPEERFEDFHDD
jgi:hypothetical protein